jgi:hypothetical protein
MFDPLVFSVAEERQKEILEEARKRQLLAIAVAARPKRWRRFFVGAGGVLVAAGASLQQTSKPTDCPDAESALVCC